MLAVAKGSKSQLVWTPETAYGATPSGATWKNMVFSGETLEQNINKLKSKDIRPDRTNPLPMGGNIATGGGVTCDFGPSRFGVFLKHLLSATAVDSAQAITTPTMSNVDEPLTRGTFINDPTTTQGLYCVTTAGTWHAANANAATIEAYFTSLVAGQTSTIPSGITGGDGNLSIFCLVPNTVATPTIYKHVITAGVNFPTVGLAIEKQILGGAASNYTLFRGTRIESLGLTIPQEDILQAAWNFLGINAVNGTATCDANTGAATTPTDHVLRGQDLSLFLNGGSTARPVKEMSLNIQNGFDPNVYQIGSRYRGQLAEGTRMASGSMTTYFTDGDEYNYFLNESDIDVLIQAINLDGLFQIEFSEVKLSGAGTPKITGPGVVVGTYDWEAGKLTATNDMVVTIYDQNASLV